MDGDERAESDLFQELRVRFLIITKKRVHADHVEDVVHETLEVILAKYRTLDRDRGLLLWSLTVLRNVIGNHYQAQRRSTAQTVQVDDWRTVPAAALSEGTPLLRALPEYGAVFRDLLSTLASEVAV